MIIRWAEDAEFRSGWEFARRAEESSVELLLHPGCPRGIASAQERRYNVLLGENDRERKMFSWDEDTAVTNPGHVL